MVQLKKKERVSSKYNSSSRHYDSSGESSSSSSSSSFSFPSSASSSLSASDDDNRRHHHHRHSRRHRSGSFSGESVDESLLFKPPLDHRMHGIVWQYKKSVCDPGLKATGTTQAEYAAVFRQVEAAIIECMFSALQMFVLLRHLRAKDEKVVQWLDVNYPLAYMEHDLRKKDKKQRHRRKRKQQFRHGKDVFYALEQHVCPDHGPSAAQRKLETPTHSPNDSVSHTFHTFICYFRQAKRLAPSAFPSQEAWNDRFMQFIGLFKNEVMKEEIQKLLRGSGGKVKVDFTNANWNQSFFWVNFPVNTKKTPYSLLGSLFNLVSCLGGFSLCQDLFTDFPVTVDTSICLGIDDFTRSCASHPVN